MVARGKKNNTQRAEGDLSTLIPFSLLPVVCALNYDTKKVTKDVHLPKLGDGLRAPIVTPEKELWYNLVAIKYFAELF